MPEYEKETTEQQRLEKEQLEDLGTVWRTRGPHAIHCLTVIGQIEGHVEAPQGQKTTKYEHVIPQLVAVQEDPAVEACWCSSIPWAGTWRPGWRWQNSLPASQSPVPRSCWAGATPSASRWQSAPGAALSCPRRP